MAESFTAAQVRKHIEDRPEGDFNCCTCGGNGEEIEMLRQYAARLDQDAQPRATDQQSGVSMRFVKQFDITTDKLPTLRSLMYGPFPPEYWETVREEGRRSVYAEVAAMMPYESNPEGPDYCWFCGKNRVSFTVAEHTLGCLYLRATQALKAASAPDTEIP